MKIENKNNKTIIYLYHYKLDIDDLEKLKKEIKNIFVKIIKRYKIDFLGYSKVDVYQNDYYGSILEVEKIYNNDFNLDIIDLKLIIHSNVNFYLEMDDYLFNKVIDGMFIENNKYYINVNSLDSIIPYIEFGKIIYKNKID